jgi:hypothetical protein
MRADTDCPLVMSNKAASLLVRQDNQTESSTVVGSGNTLSKSHADAISRAAAFRIEANLLRERAGTAGETIIREQYLALADRWAMFAANLEAELMHLGGMH